MHSWRQRGLLPDEEISSGAAIPEPSLEPFTLALLLEPSTVRMFASRKAPLYGRIQAVRYQTEQGHRPVPANLLKFRLPAPADRLTQPVRKKGQKAGSQWRESGFFSALRRPQQVDHHLHCAIKSVSVLYG